MMVVLVWNVSGNVRMFAKDWIIMINYDLICHQNDQEQYSIRCSQETMDINCR